jgi:hypothetical protein
MLRPFRVLTASLALAALSAAAGGGAPEKLDDKDPHAGLIGKPAPEVGGESDIRLGALKGKVGLLYFWTLADPGKGYGRNLLAWNLRYQKKGLRIVGVTLYNPALRFNKDTGKFQRGRRLSPKQARAMLQEVRDYHRLPFPLEPLGPAVRPGGKPAGKYVNDAYKVSTLPQAVLIDRKGNVRLVRAGPAKDNAAAVEAEIQKLLAEKP